MKIYTKTGDQGMTSLYGGVKVSKGNIRIDAYGTVDELNSFIGLIQAFQNNQQIEKELLVVQNALFVLGAELSTPQEKLFLANGKSRIGRMIQAEDIKKLENWIDAWEEHLEPMTHFILPGGGKASSSAHVARTVCRRAERIVVELSALEEIRILLQQYLNRLSDYLFVLARILAKEAGKEDVKWYSEKE